MTKLAQTKIAEARSADSDTLDLSLCGLTELPEEVFELRNLRRLALYRNNLKNLPPTIGLLKNLTYLDAENNSLSDIPEQIGELSNLEIVRLGSNCLRSLPASLAKLTQLWFLTLHDNEIETLPLGLDKLKFLRLLYLHNNLPLMRLPIWGENLSLFGETGAESVSNPAIWGPPLNDAIRLPGSPKKILECYFSDPTQRQAELLEKKLRSLLSVNHEKLQMLDVFTTWNELLEKMPSRKRDLEKEFGFFTNFRSEQVTDSKKEAFERRRRLWLLLASNNNTRILRKSNEASPLTRTVADSCASKHILRVPTGVGEHVPKSGNNTNFVQAAHNSVSKRQPNTGTILQSGLDNKSRSSSADTGKALENACIEVFRSLFSFSNDTQESLLLELRKQFSGSQFGRDIDLTFAWNARNVLHPRVKCHVECKNISERREITLAEFAPKILQYSLETEEIDYWILISPHAKPSNDLAPLIEQWNKEKLFRFKVMVWSPVNQVEELFTISKAAHQRIFPNGNLQPLEEEESKQREALQKKWLSLIAPPLRLPANIEKAVMLRRNLGDGAERKMFNDVLKDHVNIQIRLESGIVIEGTSAEAKALEWLKAKSRVLFVIGEFGSGKSVFSYLFAHRLTESYIANADDEWLPFRFTLKSFSGPSALEFRDAKLKEMGITMADWNDLLASDRQVIVILDGFDEMVKTCDEESIKRSIQKLIDCLEAFQGAKILITSRPHFYLFKRHKDYLFSWLKNPEVLHLAPLSRGTVVSFLKRGLKAPDAESLLRSLKDMNDPIGLGTKPLFLDMLRVTLDFREPQFDIEDFCSIKLYEHYVNSAILRNVDKNQLAQSELSLHTRNELLDNVRRLLMEIAVHLEASGNDYHGLAHVIGEERKSLAEMLWRGSTEGSTDNLEECMQDASSRVSVRTLLTRVSLENADKSWYVDFCHRSVREYFVATAIVEAFKCEEDQNAACGLLDSRMVNRETASFIVELLKRVHGANDMICKRLRHAHKSKAGFSGGYLLSFLLRLGFLPQDERLEWLNLDYADLSCHALNGRVFKGSSLRFVNIDNADLTGADFTDCDLTGLSMDETTSVTSICEINDHKFFVSYADGVIRQWDVGEQGNRRSKVVHTFDCEAPRLVAADNNSVIAVNEAGELIFYDLDGGNPTDRGGFNIRSDLKSITVYDDMLACLRLSGTVDNASQTPSLVAITDRIEVASSTSGFGSLVVAVNPSGLMAYSFTQGFEFRRATGESIKLPTPVEMNEHASLITSLHGLLNSSDILIVAVGLENGDVWVFEYKLNETSAEIMLCHKVCTHDGYVSCVRLVSRERIISGGNDGKVIVVELVPDFPAKPTELVRRYKCQGLIYTGVKGAVEYKLLEERVLQAAAVTS